MKLPPEDETLPIAPSMGPALESVHAPRERTLVEPRVLVLCGAAVVIAIGAALCARLLTWLIGLVTNLSFYGRFSGDFVSPAGNRLGPWVILVPVLGGLVVGLMARYGSKAIRGHGIPEAMEQVISNQSRIPARLTFLKPLSAAIAIGTGGPFGAEGPIIATGGALGSVLGQLMRTTAAERKTLLAAGAAAGMAATFGSPVSAVLLAVELLLFELRPRSLVPVAIAAATATSVRYAFVGSAPAFAVPSLAAASPLGVVAYTLIGGAVGIAAVGVTRLVYAVEDGFEKLPIHWMWWPALGGVAVGVVGLVAPRTLGVGYTNIEDIVSGSLPLSAVLVLATMKLVSWSISLGSGTSGGTLAPLFTIGGGFGAVLGVLASVLLPAWGVDPRVAALVGMAATFAGASRALLASIVFAFESTRQIHSLVPLLAGCSAAYLVSLVLMRHTIMTEKIASRGVRVPVEYVADALSLVGVKDRCSREVVTLAADDALAKVRAWLAAGGKDAQHQGFPVVDSQGRLLGVVTHRDLLDPLAEGTVRDAVKRRPVVVFEDSSLRDALDQMVRTGVGRLPVVTREAPDVVVGIVTRSDLLAAHQRSLDESDLAERTLKLPAFSWWS